MRAFLAFLLLLGALALGLGLAEADPKTTDERLSDLEASREQDRRAEALTRGKRIFAGACATCHGREGRGDGPGAADLDPRPRDLAAGGIRIRTTGSGERPLPGDLERTIRRGLPGTAMPAFGDLFSTAEIQDLVLFVLSLSPGDAPTEAKIPEIPAASPASIAQGRAIYLLSGCWSCHGVRGDGKGPASHALTDTEGRKIRAADFVHAPLKGGRNARSVARTLLTGMNGAPMPDYGQALLFAREDVADLSVLDDVLSADERSHVEQFVLSIPAKAELDALSEEGRLALRDERVAALSHYVLSLDRRKGAAFLLFREEPEREPRKTVLQDTPYE